MSHIGYPSKETYTRYVDSLELRDFMANVFQQADVDKYMAIYKRAVESSSSEAEIYQKLLEGAPEAKGGKIRQMLNGLRALKNERGTLAENLAKIIDKNREKDGYVEIGLPGRLVNTMKGLGVKGKIHVFNEYSDPIQAGVPQPYDQFHQLTYEPLPLPKESVDAVSCFAGIHHCPEAKLDAFIDSIHATLREGGLFLVREHDCEPQLASLVHSAFNSCTNTKVAAEASEVRNFKSWDEWTTYLESKGFVRVSNPLIRKGDSSDNGVVKFMKVSCDDSDNVRELLITQKPNYTRWKGGTTLTRVEWFNVESSKNLGTAKNFWDYNYLFDLKELLGTFAKSWSTARKIHSFKDVLFNEYTLMNSVLTTLMAFEYLIKGVVCLPIKGIVEIAKRILPRGTEDEDLENVGNGYQKWAILYGETLDRTPFYAQKYVPFIKEYWSNFQRTYSRSQRSTLDLLFDRKTVRNIATGVFMTFDLLFKAAVGSSIEFLYGGEDNADDREIGLIIKDKDGRISSVISDRYKGLEQRVKELGEQGIEILEVAGQKEIEIDLIVDINETVEGALYERAYLPDSDKKKIVAKRIPVSELTSLPANLHRVYDF